METLSTVTVPEIFEIVKDRHCTVFGSAPGRVPPSGYMDTVMICVNGSATGLPKPPDITVAGAQVSRARHKQCRHTLRNLNGRWSERVLFVHPGKYDDHEERFRDFGWSWRQSQTITAEERADFVYALTGYRTGGLAGSGAHSNGILALLLAAAGNASRIDMCGFSFSGGHFYVQGETVRNHVDHDRHALEWLARNANVRATDKEMRDLFGFPPLTG